jgi:hypothetical protein
MFLLLLSFMLALGSLPFRLSPDGHHTPLYVGSSSFLCLCYFPRPWILTPTPLSHTSSIAPRSFHSVRSVHPVGAFCLFLSLPLAALALWSICTFTTDIDFYISSSGYNHLLTVTVLWSRVEIACYRSRMCAAERSRTVCKRSSAFEPEHDTPS